VGDEEVGEPALPAEGEHQPEQLRPDRDVQHRDRLVRHDQLRSDHERTGDHDTLALAARQFMGIAGGVLLGGAQAGSIEGAEDALATLARRAKAVDDQRLGDEIVDRLLRVEGLVRVLEDDLDPAPVVAQG
jgi:hypothetical protein